MCAAPASDVPLSYIVYANGRAGSFGQPINSINNSSILKTVIIACTEEYGPCVFAGSPCSRRASVASAAAATGAVV